MPRVSREEFQRRLDTQHQLQITLLNYDGATKPATFKYECCGTEKSLSSAKGIFRSKSCPGCSPGTNKHTAEYVQKTFLDKHGIVMLGEYKHEKSPILMRFPCGCEYIKTVSAMKAGNGVRCTKCNSRIVNHVISIDEANTRLKSGAYGNYTIVGYYTGMSNPTDIKCNNCGGIHYGVSPTNILKRCRGCSICNGLPQKSHKEMYLRQVLTDIGVKYICEYNIPGTLLRLDFYFPDLLKGIEYDGEWHDIIEAQKSRDKLKTSKLKEEGIELLRLNYKESGLVTKVLQFLNF